MENARRVAATRGLAMVSAGAGAIHLAVIGKHTAASPLYGVFFALVAAFQLGWALLMISRPSRMLYLAGALGNAVVIATWAVSRSTGVPIGPGAGIPEPVGFIDGVASAYEAVIVGGAMVIMQAAPDPPRALRSRTRSLAGWGRAGAVGVLTALALVFPGSAHHDAAHSIGHSHAAMPHHGLHIVVLGAAGAVFLAFLAFYIWENGWAGFSWRLRPGSPQPPRRSRGDDGGARPATARGPGSQ
jgi:hypothetical protein